MRNKSDGVDRIMTLVGTLSPVFAAIHAKGDLRLAHLLTMTRPYKATDLSDKIFALLGLTTGVPGDFIDYNLNLRQVLNNFGLLLLTQKSVRDAPALDILSFVDYAHRSLDLPSWVPEWKYATESFFPLSLIMEPQERVKVGQASYRVDHKV